MAAAAAQGEPHGMLSVVGLPDAELQRLCDRALVGLPKGTVCRIANYMFPLACGGWGGGERGDAGRRMDVRMSGVRIRAPPHEIESQCVE